MDGYPITPEGKNTYAQSDNRDTKGGCFAGRDVHSNPDKDKDGAGTPEHLNAIGQWLQTNVSRIGNHKNGKGLWCTNCHSQLSRELYQRDNISQAFRQEGTTLRNTSLEEIAKAIGVSEEELIDFARQRLASYKVPTRVLFTDEPLPRNAANKLLKPAIRESALTHFGLQA